MWAVMYYPKPELIAKFQTTIYENMQLVFYKDVFAQDSLILDKDIIVKLLITGGKFKTVKRMKNTRQGSDAFNGKHTITAFIFERFQEFAEEMERRNSGCSKKEIINECILAFDIGELSSNQLKKCYDEGYLSNE